MGKLSVKNIFIGLVLAAFLVAVGWGVYRSVFRSKSSSSSGSSSSGSSGGNCTVPTPPATEGYDLSNVTGSLSKDGFSITGVGCATGYTGTEPRAIACSVAGQDYTLSGCSASTAGSGGSSSTNPCSLAGVVPPSNGTLGTTCANTEGSLEHGASCDMTCSEGYNPTNQPQCNNGVLSSNTATCIPVVPAPVPTCSDINGDGTEDDAFDCGTDILNPDGVCSSGSCNTEYCCNTASPAGSDVSGTALTPTCSDINGDGTAGDAFDCGTDILNPDGVCSSGSCTTEDCCNPASPAGSDVSGTAPRCIRPTNTEITDSYDFTNARETLTMDRNFSVSGITCNPGYGPGGDNIVAGICDSADTAYTLTGCSDTNGCDGIDCGAGATCRDNPAPQTGYTCLCGPGYMGDNVVNGVANCTNIEFSLSGPGESCTSHCGGQEKQCLNQTEEAASVFHDPLNNLDILPTECGTTNTAPQDGSAYWQAQSSSANHLPYLFSESEGCYYYPEENPVNISTCDASLRYANKRRICACGNQ